MPTTESTTFPMGVPPPVVRARVQTAYRRASEIPSRVLDGLPSAGIPRDELGPILKKDQCFRNLLTRYHQAESISLPTAKEVARAWRQVEAAYKKWLLMRTGRETKTVRTNEVLTKMQARAVMLRRREVMARLAKIRMKSNAALNAVPIRAPELSAVLGAQPSTERK